MSTCFGLAQPPNAIWGTPNLPVYLCRPMVRKTPDAQRKRKCAEIGHALAHFLRHAPWRALRRRQWLLETGLELFQ
eukprot:11156730-Lingulodinium_polyedra.AAC.1